MKYCIFKENKYTGLAYSELTENIKDFHKNDLIVALESIPLYKVDDYGKVLETLTLTQEESDAYAKEYKISDLKSQLRAEKFLDAQAKCLSDGLVFADKYPDLQEERLTIVAEINALG